MIVKKETLTQWSVEDSADVYGIRNWSAGYFDISNDGEVVVSPSREEGGKPVSLMDIVSGIKDRGLGMPVLLRIGNILDSQISLLHDSFRKAIAQAGYKGEYRGIYPIKVNQQSQVVKEITSYGSKYHHGLEAGSKAELIAALGMLEDMEACMVCNGYKDEEFIDLGLYATKLGYKCFLVVEMASELRLILDRAAKLNVRPLIGIRIKLSTKAGGQWTESGGDRSVFGLSITELLEVVDILKEQNALDCLKLLHYHIGSQIPNIRDIRSGVREACRVYTGLVEEGAPMGYLDLGGGLAVDYDGSHTNFPGSRNYSIDEYCADIVECVLDCLDQKQIPHPVIITESGRATVAYYSVLLFNILDVSRFETGIVPESLPENANETMRNLMEVWKSLCTKNLQECYNDAIFYRDEIRQQFKNGTVSLRERALSEKIFWNVVVTVARESKKLKYIPDEFEGLDTALADTYYANFSVFQSLPDSWAIQQVFPIMPIHRLKEAPLRQGVLSDITCDCDGKIDHFVDLHDERHTLPLHDLKPDEEYYLGAFLVGAYQETLGDLHNLLGDTNIVSIRISKDGTFDIVKEIEGDSVSDVLSYVEYDTKDLIEYYRDRAERAVKEGRISPAERREIMSAFETGLRGYTYFER